MFGSRTVLLGLALAVLAVTGKRRGLAWVLFADAALQVFDTVAIAMHKGAIAALPLVIGGLDAGAGTILLRSRWARLSACPPPKRGYISDPFRPIAGTRPALLVFRGEALP